MLQTTVGIDGMMCGMCESHINDAIRNHFAVKKVTASHKKGEAVIVSEEPMDEKNLQDVIAELGYEVKSVTTAPYEKKSILPWKK